MGKLRKASHQDVPLVSSLDSAESGGEPFVPNDFGEDGCYPVSMDLSDDEGGLDKALLKFYLNQVCYLDHLNFGLHSVPDVKPRILAWRGNKVKQFSELDRSSCVLQFIRSLLRNLQQGRMVMFPSATPSFLR